MHTPRMCELRSSRRGSWGSTACRSSWSIGAMAFRAHSQRTCCCRCSIAPGLNLTLRCSFGAWAAGRQALLALPRHARYNESVAYVITQPCIDVKDKSCVNVCPVSCIYIDSDDLDRKLYI